MAAAGRFGQSHLVMAMLEKAADVHFRPLFAEGGGPALAAVLSGHAAAYTAPLSAATPHIRSGRLRALAHSGVARMPAFPDVPSFKESGIELEFYSWFAMFAPAKTPAAVIKVLEDALRQAVQNPGFKAEMGEANLQIDYRDGAEFRAWYQREHERMVEIVQSLGRIDEGPKQ